jgi:polyhydroxyalkanoate synthase
MEAHAPQDGSWWMGWAEWLGDRSGERVAPPPLGNAKAGYKPLGDAPGSYIHQP